MLDPRITRLAEVLCDHSCSLGPDDRLLIHAFDIPDEAIAEIVRVAQSRGAKVALRLESNLIRRQLMLGMDIANAQLIANVEKHSGARQVAVTLSSDSDNVCVSIDDDGQGFEPILVDREEDFGLQLMRERVEAIGGLFQIVTSIGIGTNVVARIPRQPQWWS